MAKELGMLENNTRGKQVRKYFIDCETMLIRMLSIQTSLYRQQLEQPNRIVIKRNSLDVTAHMLEVDVDYLLSLLSTNNYCDESGFPLPKAFGHFDMVDNTFRWSLPLIIRLMKA